MKGGAIMPLSSAEAQAAGRAGGLRRAALAANPQEITAAASEERWQRYVDQVRAVLPEITDEAEITRRAELLRKADMAGMSQKAAKARRMKRELARKQAEIVERQAQLADLEAELGSGDPAA
jgi:hypothetical protein